jgi:hypothetical protein
MVQQGPVRVLRVLASAARVVRVAAPAPARVLSVARQGRPGPPGERGAKGDPGEVAGTLDWAQITGKPQTSYLHIQPTAAAVWVINHNLDTPPLHVSVQDLAGSGLDGYDVDHPSRFQTRLTFSPPAAGSARLS